MPIRTFLPQSRGNSFRAWTLTIQDGCQIWTVLEKNFPGSSTVQRIIIKVPFYCVFRNAVYCPMYFSCSTVYFQMTCIVLYNPLTLMLWSFCSLVSQTASTRPGLIRAWSSCWLHPSGLSGSSCEPARIQNPSRDCTVLTSRFLPSEGPYWGRTWIYPP